MGRAALPANTGPAVDPVRRKGALPRRAGRFGVEPLLGRNYWPQGQLRHTLLLGNSQCERESDMSNPAFTPRASLGSKEVGRTDVAKLVPHA